MVEAASIVEPAPWWEPVSMVEPAPWWEPASTMESTSVVDVHLDGDGSLPSVAGLGLGREPALAMRASIREENQCALGASARGRN